MGKSKGDSTLVLLLSLAIVFSIGGVVLNYMLLSSIDVPIITFTGRVTDSTSTVTLTQAGSAGITMADAAIAFGSGYYNSSCTTGGSELDSNKTYGGSGTNDQRITPQCWINTTTLFSNVDDSHAIRNNGSVKVNLSAYGDKLDGETLFCGSAGGCPFTTVAGVSLLSENGETSSCTSTLTTGFEVLMTQDTNLTVGLCDALDFQDTSDEIEVSTKITVPKDATAGAKTLTITYQAAAV